MHPVGCVILSAVVAVIVIAFAILTNGAVPIDISAVVVRVISVTIGAVEIIAVIEASFAYILLGVLDIIHIIAAFVFAAVRANLKVFIYAVFTVEFTVYLNRFADYDFTTFGTNLYFGVIITAVLAINMPIKEYLAAVLTYIPL